MLNNPREFFFVVAAWVFLVLTVVAMFSVHWPESWTTWAELLKGYALTNDGFGNFKLPVIYIAMLLPLVLMGPGRLSADHLFLRGLAKTRP